MTEADGSEQEIDPRLKFALEMGPLVVFRLSDQFKLSHMPHIERLKI